MSNHTQMHARSTTRQLTRTAAPLAALILALGAGGCKTKDADKCQEGQAGVKKSLEAHNDALLTQWRDYAYKYCEAAVFAGIDREIADTRAAEKKAEADQQHKQQELDQLLQLFTQWVAGARNNPERAATPTCGGGEAEAKSHERWCVGQRQASPYVFTVRYWDKEPVAAKFDVTLPQPITCEKLGGVALRTWTVPNQAIKRQHCQINSGPLAGMQAMVTEAVNAPLHVFSPQYLEKDAALSAKLTTEGQ
jgi:hypothetical protein